MRRLLTLFLIIFSYQLAFATGDSLNYLTAQDTVLLEINDRAQKLFKHKLEKNQTLYSLANYYGLSLDMLFDYNPELKGKTIHPNQTITVPIPNKAIIRVLKQGMDASKMATICYKVKPGDTMFGIAKRHFRMPVETLKKKNGLKTNTLVVGQRLKVGWMKLQAISKDWQYPAGTPVVMTQENRKNKVDFQRKNYKRKTVKEIGKAQWNSSDDINLKGLYCLHSKAPVGTIIRIENPMTKSVTYAKVVGKVPFNYEKWVILVVSEDVAKALQVKNSRFFARLEYFIK